jgi:sirohydrochlorin ferrochelatase
MNRPTSLIVLLSPGTDDRALATALTALATRVEAALEGPAVRIAYVDRAWPTLTATVGRELDRGLVDEVIVVPLFLHSGYPATVDVPAVVAQAHLDHAVQVRVTAPLGSDPRLIPALERQAPGSRPVVLAVDDTRDGAARERLQRLADAWSATRGTPVAVGYATTAPTVETVQARLKSGRVRPATVPLSIESLAGAPELADVVVGRISSQRTAPASPVGA